jgi:hypothetical protein
VEVFQTIPSVTSSSAGASLPVDARDGHVYSEQRRLAYRLFQLRAELATFEGQFAGVPRVPARTLRALVRRAGAPSQAGLTKRP